MRCGWSRSADGQSCSSCWPPPPSWAVLKPASGTSKSETRWRIKYLVLGLGGIFLMRFFLLSQMLLFHVVLAVYLTTIAAALFLGNLLVAGSLLRERLSSWPRSRVSRRVVYRSAVVGVLGAYLLVVGALGWLLSHLGIPEELFWGSLVVFVTAVGLAAILFSENVRWRFKRLGRLAVLSGQVRLS